MRDGLNITLCEVCLRELSTECIIGESHVVVIGCDFYFDVKLLDRRMDHCK